MIKNFQFPISNFQFKQALFFVVVLVMFIFSATIGSQTVLADNSTGSAGNTSSGNSVGSAGNTGPVIGTLANPLKVNSVGELVNTILVAITYLAVLFAVLALIWVGFKFIAARGNPAKTKEAGQWLGYIVIGIAVILGARLILAIVLNTLQATGTLNPQVIQSAQNALNSSSQ